MDSTLNKMLISSCELVLFWIVTLNIWIEVDAGIYAFIKGDKRLSLVKNGSSANGGIISEWEWFIHSKPSNI